MTTCFGLNGGLGKRVWGVAMVPVGRGGLVLRARHDTRRVCPGCEGKRREGYRAPTPESVIYAGCEISRLEVRNGICCT